MSFIYSMLDTWNNAGTTFNSIYMNTSDGAGGSANGAAASRLLRLDNNGTFVFDVAISGATRIASSTASTTTSTGALIITGGLGLGGAIFAGSNINIPNKFAYKINAVSMVYSDTPNGNYCFAPSGNTAMTGTFNVTMGFSAGASITTGASNFLFGSFTGFNLLAGSNNVLFGNNIAFNLAGGSNNVILGGSSGGGLTSGSSNTFLGDTCGAGILTGQFNTFIGGNISATTLGIGDVSSTVIIATSNGAVRFFSDASSNTGVQTITPLATFDVGGPIRVKTYTVATLPAGVEGMMAAVTNAVAPAYGVALVNGGTVHVPAYYDGTSWIAA